jgi:hypothetical protein
VQSRHFNARSPRLIGVFDALLSESREMLIVVVSVQGAVYSTRQTVNSTQQAINSTQQAINCIQHAIKSAHLSINSARRATNSIQHAFTSVHHLDGLTGHGLRLLRHDFLSRDCARHSAPSPVTFTSFERALRVRIVTASLQRADLPNRIAEPCHLAE